MEKVPSLSAVSLSVLFFWNKLTALSEGCLYSVIHKAICLLLEYLSFGAVEETLHLCMFLLMMLSVDHYV
jgi:hypothetical protein